MGSTSAGWWRGFFSLYFFDWYPFSIYESGFGAEKFPIKMPDTLGCVWLIDDKPLGGERRGK